MAKAGRPKKGSAGLPGWFDIEHYRAARDFTAMKWYEQTIFRARLFEAHEGCVREGDKFFSRLQPAFQMIQNCPIIDDNRFFFETLALSTENGVEKDISHGKKGKVVRVPDPAIGLSIRPARGTAFQRLSAYDYRHLSPKDFELPTNISPKSFDDNGNLILDIEPLRYHERPVFAVDLAIKDEIIIRGLREFLKEERKKTKPLPLAFVKDSDFLKWYNSGVLPYLDLMLWQKMGHDFTAAAFVKELSQILDKPISSESAAIKAAQSYAKKILEPGTVRLLEAQALREFPYGTKKSGKFLVR